MKKSLKDLQASVPTLDVHAQSQIKGGKTSTPPATSAVVSDDLNGF